MGYWRRLCNVTGRVYLDLATPETTVFVAGMARSGTTWLADVINHDRSHRVVFEPFNTALVPQARPFDYIQYVNPARVDQALVPVARRILAGRVRNAWVDTDNRGFLFRRRLIKAIRANLMLAWLADLVPPMRVVLIVRHPLAVAASWLRLGWEADALESLASCRALLDDFPVIADAAREVNLRDPLLGLVFQWGVFHLVPLRQAPPDRVLVLRYEDLVSAPDEECRRLFRYLGRAYEAESVGHSLSKPSRTEHGGTEGRDRRLHGWHDAFDASQLKAVESLLSRLGLGALYPDEALPRPA